MKKSHYLFLVVVMVALGAVYYFGFGRNGSKTADIEDKLDMNMNMEETPVLTVGPSPDLSPASVSSPDISPTPGGVTKVKEFKVTASNFKYSLNEIKVKKGDKVRIVLSNDGGFHDWVVDELNAKTKRISAGQTDTIEFVADKVGTFEYYCSVMNHRQMGMKGNLIVE